MNRISKSPSHSQKPRRLGFVLAGILGLAQISFGQKVYSYVNENGIRVLTNIPPKNAMVSPIQNIQTRLLDTGGVPVTQNISNPGFDPAIQKQGENHPGGTRVQETPHLQNGVLRAATAPNPGSPKRRLSAPVASTSALFDPLIEKYASENRLDPSLIRSIIATESGFNPAAISNKGARGLMQLMPATAYRLGVSNVHDAEENIKGGTRYLRTLLDMFDNDLALSLAAYNAGENLVQRIGRIPDIRETHAYVRAVQRRYGKKEMAPITLHVEANRPPPMFRFVDSQGVLNFTNIAPTQRLEADSALLTSGSQAPQ